MIATRSVAMRIVSCGLSAVLVYSSSAIGINAAVNAVGRIVASKATEISRLPRGHYTDHPSVPYLGLHPTRDAATRGGLWARNIDLRDPAIGRPLFAQAVQPASIQPGGSDTYTAVMSVSLDSGSSFPWEGSSPSAGGSTNTNTGNKLTQVPVIGWTARGGGNVGLSLVHNSESSDNSAFGQHWTFSYDIYVVTTSGSPVVHWGDGLCIPYSTGSSGGTVIRKNPGATPIFDSADVSSEDQTPVLDPGTGTGSSSTTYTPPSGIYDQLVQNSDGTWTITKKDKTVYTLNSAGFLSSITDRNGNVTTVTANSNHYITQVTDPSGRSLTFTLNSTTGRYSSVTDPAGNVYSFTYDSSGDLTAVTWPSLGDGNTYTDGFTYDSGYRILTHTDKRGKVWSFGYNSSGAITSETDPLGHAKTYTYGTSSTTITDPLGHTVVDNYSNGLLASEVDESGYSVSYPSYDTNHNILTKVDARGKSWAYTYDSNGNVLTVTDPLSHAKTYTYNSFNEPLTSVDALGNSTSYAYDTHGNLLTTTNPLSVVVQTNTYDSYGQLATTANALGKTTTYSRDTYGNVTSVVDPLSHGTSTTYDILGHATSTTDPLSHTTSVAYDAWGRAYRVTNSDTSTVVKAFDANGNVLSVTDELNHTTTNVYDNAGRLTSTTNPRGDGESYVYDNANRRTSVTNGRGKTRTYTFTNRGEVASLTLPDGSVEQWAFDGNGHTTAYVNPLNQTIQYVFDNAGRQTGITYPTGTNVSFAYDNADRETSMVDSTGTTTWTYDAASRLTALATPQGNLSYTYDDASRRTGMTESAGSWSYVYDDASRLTSQTNPFSETTTFGYDAANRKTSQTFANGQVDAYGYDNRNRQTSVSHNKSDSTVISSESYVYDVAGNLSSKTVDSATTTYGYDNADQLTSETAPTFTAVYTYDANGNRLSKTLNGTTDSYTYDDGDKLLSTSTKSYTYDAAGRTTAVTTSAGTTSLAYDYEGRVTGITYPGGATNSFTYNGLDTRVCKVDSAGTSTYKRDGVEVTDEVLSDGSASYTSGISERRAGTTTYNLTDRQGSVTAQSVAAQIVVAMSGYDAFGGVASNSGVLKGPFGFGGAVGYQTDSDSGLQLLGHRYYDPSTGRFLTRDPTKDGRNWYCYCENNPVHNADPDGLKPGDKYKNKDQAAIGAIKENNDASIGNGCEYSGWIYQNPDGTCSYTIGDSSNNNGATSHAGDPKKVLPDGTTLVGHWHTHGRPTGPEYGTIAFDDENFSSPNPGQDPRGFDTTIYDGRDIVGYLGTPRRKMKKYTPVHGKDGKVIPGKGKVEPLGPGHM